MGKYLVDGELIIRPIATAAAVATGSTAAFALPAAYAGDFKLVIQVDALVTGGGETYTFSVEADTAVGFATPVAVVTLPATTAPGLYEVPLSGAQIAALEPGATHLRVTHTLVGVTAEITYAAWLTR